MNTFTFEFKYLYIQVERNAARIERNRLLLKANAYFLQRYALSREIEQLTQDIAALDGDSVQESDVLQKQRSLYLTEVERLTCEISRLRAEAAATDCSKLMV